MRPSKGIIIFTIWTCSSIIGFSQSDSTILTYQEYLQNIISFHPLIKKANLQSARGDAENLSAKGTLDPKINSSWNEKDFDKKLYYRQYQAKFKIPTQLGIDVVGGYENTEGVFLNPENNTDRYGLWNLGIEVNALQGLIVNERKTALEQAAIFQNLSENNRQILINEILYSASKAYLDWQKYFYFKNVFIENIEIAQTYFNNTKISFENGEKTAMDTLEANIAFQDANNLFQKNESKLIKARQVLENYLWLDETPIILQTTTQPENYEDTFRQNEINLDTTNLINTHPLILTYFNKRSYFEIAQRLKREKLKPKLKLKYNPLLATSNNLAPTFSTADYKWGFDFSMPLLFRKERADIQKGAIKIQETNLDIENKINELQNKIENSFQQQNVLRTQIALSEQNLEGYRILLEGENEKFRFGESSVFLLNKRQEKYINSRLKLIELNIKLQMELLNYLYFSNQLIE